LAMAGTGFKSVCQSKAMKNATSAFVIGGMVTGAALACDGLSLASVETGITFSVLVARFPIATLAGALMVFHGFAHGAEMPEGATLAAYLEGFFVATLAITLFGGSLMLKADSRFSRRIGWAFGEYRCFAYGMLIKPVGGTWLYFYCLSFAWAVYFPRLLLILI